MTTVEMVSELPAEVVEATHGAAPAARDWEAVLRSLQLDPRLPEVQALVMVANRYGLDPLLRHIRLIPEKDAFSVYVTRDGMIHVAHRSGQLDGIVVDEQRRNSKDDGYTAFVSVWRKDMSHPFRYGAQCKDTERQARNGWGPEQAVARAERRSLIRAFEIQVADDVQDDDVTQLAPVTARESRPAVSAPEAEQAPARNLWPGWPARPDQAEAHRRIGALTESEKAAWLRERGIADFGSVWPDDAAADALTREH